MCFEILPKLLGPLPPTAVTQWNTKIMNNEWPAPLARLNWIAVRVATLFIDVTNGRGRCLTSTSRLIKEAIKPILELKQHDRAAIQENNSRPKSPATVRLQLLRLVQTLSLIWFSLAFLSFTSLHLPTRPQFFFQFQTLKVMKRIVNWDFFFLFFFFHFFFMFKGAVFDALNDA